MESEAEDELEALRAIFGDVHIAASDTHGEQTWRVPLGDGRVFSVSIPVGYPRRPARGFAVTNEPTGDGRGSGGGDAPPVDTDHSEADRLAVTAAAAAAAGQAVVFELIQQVQAPPTESTLGDASAASDHALGASPGVVDLNRRARSSNGDDRGNGSAGVDALLSLPPELWLVIFAFLPLRDLLPASAVCRRWRSCVETDLRWTRTLDQWIRTRPGYGAFRPRPRHANFFTFNALVRAQSPVVCVTRQRPLPFGSSRSDRGRRDSTGVSTCHVILSTMTDAHRPESGGCFLQQGWYGAAEPAPRGSVIAWAARAVDLYAGATGIRRMLLLPGGGIGISAQFRDATFNSNIFLAAPPEVRWSELPEPIFLPERAKK